jgi:hypothetical protein
MLVFLSCSGASDKDLVQYRHGRQVLNLNGVKRNGQKLDEFKIEKISPDSITTGQKFLAKVFFTSKDIELVAAYIDCDAVEIPTVDTLVNTTNNYKRLDGCKEGLVVENDTIYIRFTAGQPGKKNFEEVTILTRDTEKVFRTQKYSFDYKVVEN